MTIPMEVSTTGLFTALTRGTNAEKAEAIRLLEGRLPKVDYEEITNKILKALNEEYRPPRSKTEKDLHSPVRCFLLSALGRMPVKNGEPERTLREHAGDSEKEPNHWARYWALEALRYRDAKGLEEFCRDKVSKDPDLLPRFAAIAILADRGDDDALEKILNVLKSEDENELWGVLRALRLVYLPAAVDLIFKLVKEDRFNDITYDSIVALGTIPPESPAAVQAAIKLQGFITSVRNYQFWDVFRIRAIESLGMLKVDHTADLLLAEMADYNPSIARAAALALEAVLGTSTAVGRVLERLLRVGDRNLARYASALREMKDRDEVERTIASAMSAPKTEEQDYARTLMSELGGTSAFDRLRAQTDATKQYAATLGDADRSMRKLFDRTMRHAKRGFSVVLYMDVAVFVLGILLLGISAYMILSSGGEQKYDRWVAAFSAGGGVFAMILSRWIAKPREQVQRAVQRLSQSNAIFLGYLRQLRQVDQAYTRRMLDDESPTAEEIKGFCNLIQETMNNAMRQLQNPGSVSAEAASSEANGDETP